MWRAARRYGGWEIDAGPRQCHLAGLTNDGSCAGTAGLERTRAGRLERRCVGPPRLAGVVSLRARISEQAPLCCPLGLAQCTCGRLAGSSIVCAPLAAILLVLHCTLAKVERLGMEVGGGTLLLHLRMKHCTSGWRLERLTISHLQGRTKQFHSEGMLRRAYKGNN